MKTLSDEIIELIGKSKTIFLKREVLDVEDVKEFIKKRIKRIKLIIKLYPHKSGEELAEELIEDLINDAGEELI